MTIYATTPFFTRRRLASGSAYDLNPVPVDIKPRILSTAIDEADGTASLDLAYQVAEHSD